MQKITGIDIQEHDQSKRIIKISLENNIIDKLIFPFNKFDLTALELKPFTRFTLAKSLEVSFIPSDVRAPKNLDRNVARDVTRIA